MEMILENGFVALQEDDMLLIDAGESVAYKVGYYIGAAAGLVYDGMVIVHAVLTGSF